MTDAALIEAAFPSSGQGLHDFTYVPKPLPPTPLRSFLSADTILTIGVDVEGQRLNRVERACGSWAAAHGIPVPQVLDADADDDGAWLLARRVHTRAAEGVEFVHDALDVADRGAALPARTWRSPPASGAAAG